MCWCGWDNVVDVVAGRGQCIVPAVAWLTWLWWSVAAGWWCMVWCWWYGGYECVGSGELFDFASNGFIIVGRGGSGGRWWCLDWCSGGGCAGSGLGG